MGAAGDDDDFVLETLDHRLDTCSRFGSKFNVRKDEPFLFSPPWTGANGSEAKERT